MEFRVVCNCWGTCRVSRGRGRRSTRVLSAAASVAQQSEGMCRQMRVYLLHYGKINFHIVQDEGHQCNDTLILDSACVQLLYKLRKICALKSSCAIKLALKSPKEHPKGESNSVVTFAITTIARLYLTLSANSVIIHRMFCIEHAADLEKKWLSLWLWFDQMS